MTTFVCLLLLTLAPCPARADDPLKPQLETVLVRLRDAIAKNDLEAAMKLGGYAFKPGLSAAARKANGRAIMDELSSQDGFTRFDPSKFAFEGLKREGNHAALYYAASKEARMLYIYHFVSAKASGRWTASETLYDDASAAETDRARRDAHMKEVIAADHPDPKAAAAAEAAADSGGGTEQGLYDDIRRKLVLERGYSSKDADTRMAEIRKRAEQYQGDARLTFLASVLGGQ